MAEQVGGIYYDVSLDTSKMLDGQRKVDRALRETSGSLDGFKGKVTAVASAVSVLAVAMAAVNSARMADDMRLLAARVTVAAGSIEAGAKAMVELEAISRRTRTGLAANVDVFNRLNQSILQMGGTQDDTLKLTELLGKAIKVSGASAGEAQAAMLQFSQALGSGKLAGDELRSLLETSPYLMRQLADGIGVPVGALKDLGANGKLTADVIMAALGKAADKIDSDFKNLPQTFDEAMTAVRDSASQANKAFDDLTGTSQVLTGIADGVAKAFQGVAEWLKGAKGEGDNLGKSTAVEDWSRGTAKVLSYVADGADLVSRMFRQTGTAIGGVAAAIGAAATGEFKQARDILGMMVDDIKAIGNAEYAGASMRRNMESLFNQGGGRSGGFSDIKAPGGSEDVKKKKGQQFDSEAYLSGLRKAAASEIGVINEAEVEKLRVAKKYLDERKISEKEYAEAVKLITEDAEAARVEAMKKAQDQIDEARERSEAEARQLLEERKRKEKEAVDYAANLTRAVNPLDALRQEYEAKLELVRQYEAMMAQAGVDATLQGQQARTQITNEYELQRLALAEQTFRSQGEAQAFLIDSLNSLSQTAANSLSGLLTGTMTAQDAMRALATTVLNEAVSSLIQFGMQQVKNALLADTIAAAEKAKAAANGAVYAASVSAQVTGMSALAAQNAFAATAAIPIIGPGLAPAAAAAAGAAAAAIGAPAVATAPIAGARQYGGAVNAGSMYRINETGKSEMFVGSNGSQYMIPAKNGRIVAANDIGMASGTAQGAGWVGDINVKVDVNQNGEATSTAATEGQGQTARQLGDMVTAATKEVMVRELRPGGLLWQLKQGQV